MFIKKVPFQLSMIVEKEFIKKLSHQLNLNVYEAKLWTALLSRGVSTAGELSDIANVPRSRSYDVLESLQKKGFIIQKLGKPIKYVALPPAEVVERVKKQIKEDSEKHLAQMETLKDSEVIKELELLHTKGIELIEPTDMAGSIRGKNSVYDQMEMMIKGAEESIIMMTTESGFTGKVEAFKKAFTKAHERGVSIHILVPDTKVTREKAKELDKIATVRFCDVTARFVIVDNEEIMFMLLDDANVHPSYEVGVWVNTPFFTSALAAMFETMFEKVAVKH
jgi:HTH-type transcriptional regulator, sugar sensing transcriptional regulator